MFPEESDYQEIAILSDFDGVISKINVLEALYKEFSPVDWQRYVTMWENEELSAADEIPFV